MKLHQNAFSGRAGGAPPGPVRERLMRALEAGAVGSYECIAQRAGVAANEARYTLDHLRRAGFAARVDKLPLASGAGRPRAVYARAQGGGQVFDSLQELQRLWR